MGCRYHILLRLACCASCLLALSTALRPALAAAAGDGGSPPADTLALPEPWRMVLLQDGAAPQLSLPLSLDQLKPYQLKPGARGVYPDTEHYYCGFLPEADGAVYLVRQLYQPRDAKFRRVAEFRLFPAPPQDVLTAEPCLVERIGLPDNLAAVCPFSLGPGGAPALLLVDVRGRAWCASFTREAQDADSGARYRVQVTRAEPPAAAAAEEVLLGESVDSVPMRIWDCQITSEAVAPVLCQVGDMLCLLANGGLPDGVDPSAGPQMANDSTSVFVLPYQHSTPGAWVRQPLLRLTMPYPASEMLSEVFAISAPVPAPDGGMLVALTWFAGFAEELPGRTSAVRTRIMRLAQGPQGIEAAEVPWAGAFSSRCMQTHLAVCGAELLVATLQYPPASREAFLSISAVPGPGAAGAAPAPEELLRWPVYYDAVGVGALQFCASPDYAVACYNSGAPYAGLNLVLARDGQMRDAAGWRRIVLPDWGAWYTLSINSMRLRGDTLELAGLLVLRPEGGTEFAMNVLLSCDLPAVLDSQ